MFTTEALAGFFGHLHRQTLTRLVVLVGELIVVSNFIVPLVAVMALCLSEVLFSEKVFVVSNNLDIFEVLLLPFVVTSTVKREEPS